MEGYVYILTNAAMPGLIKIGRTKRSPEERRRELSNPTGVPLDFNIAYEIFSFDMVELEKSIQKSLKAHRLNDKREFFSYDLSRAIYILQQKAEEIRLDRQYKITGVNELLDTYEAIEILGSLKSEYPNMIKEELISVRIYQTKLRCFLETTEQKNYGEDDPRRLINQKIYRLDLGYIVDNDDPDNFILFFKPSVSVAENARKFLKEFDGYNKLMSGCELFNKYGEGAIQERYNKEHKSK